VIHIRWRWFSILWHHFTCTRTEHTGGMCST